MTDARSITWGSVRPRIESAIDECKDALVAAAPADVLRLQCEARALITLKAWFEAGARQTDAIFPDDDGSY